MVCLLYYTIVISNVHSILGLASKKKKCQVPFSRIAKNQSEFIESKYIPRRMTLNDPRAMKREEIIQFFKHIETRQVSHGIQDAFRFRATLSSRKKGSLRKQEYSETFRTRHRFESRHRGEEIHHEIRLLNRKTTRQLITRQ